MSAVPQSDFDPNAPETEEAAELRAGWQMMIGRAVQNVQFEARSKGLELGPISAIKIIEMADKGELEGFSSLESLRRLVRAEKS